MAEIPTADWGWINAAADRFERAGKQGLRPRIEDYLAEVDESLWPSLLEELMRVESELRRPADEEPTVAEYERRFAATAAGGLDHGGGVSPGDSASAPRASAGGTTRQGGGPRTTGASMTA